MNNPIYAAALRETWAIQPEFLQWAITDASEAVGQRAAKLPRVNGGVAILPVHGMISQRSSIFSEMFGGTATESLASGFSRAINSERVNAIVLDVDSPGGTTSGVEMVADLIHSGRGIKPIIAVANSLAASAAFWIASSADHFAAAPGADVGSIGVFRMHEDHSEELAADGVKVTFISTPDFKVEGNPFEPLSEAGLKHHQEQVDATFGAFNAAVARNRGVSKASAKASFGKGRSFNAQQAAEINLVDRVASMTKIMRELGVDGGRAKLVNAAETAELTEELIAAWTDGTQERLERVTVSSRRHGLRRRELDLKGDGR